MELTAATATARRTKIRTRTSQIRCTSFDWGRRWIFRSVLKPSMGLVFAYYYVFYAYDYVFGRRAGCPGPSRGHERAATTGSRVRSLPPSAFRLACASNCGYGLRHGSKDDCLGTSVSARARSGRVAGLPEIATSLNREGYSVKQIEGPLLKRQLSELIKASRLKTVTSDPP